MVRVVDINQFDPKKDGIDHINAYSGAKTNLGRELSNFAHSPFSVDDHGSFASLEGYWYWLQTRNEKLRLMFGYEAKSEGRKARRAGPKHLADDSEEFKAHVIKAIEAKLSARPSLAQELKGSHLPIVHYYTKIDSSNGAEYAVPLSKHRWVWQEYERIRDNMQGIERQSEDDSHSGNEHQLGLF